MKLILCFIAITGLFAPIAAYLPPLRKTTVRKSVNLHMSMPLRDLPGSLPPMGYFDPLGFSENISAKELKKWREAELKHGRVAMLAAAGMLVAERFNPLFGGKVIGAAAYHFQQVENIFPPFWYLILFGIALVEGHNIIRGWESPGEQSNPTVAMLKDDYIPGDLGFDPLGLKPVALGDFMNMQTKELQNGRLAMIGVAGMLVQELVDKRSIFDHFNQFGFSPASYGAPL